MEKYKILIIVVIGLALVVGAIAFLTSFFIASSIVSETSTENRTVLEEYFMEEMWRRAVENMDGRMPIEGFDAQLFMGAYPGLEEEDFNGVDAINGEWKIVNGELEFVMASGELITSADGTINEQGMKELLVKLESRFVIKVLNKEDVDSLIDRLE